jgi:hypothetical protein
MSRGAIGYNARGMAEVKKRILFEIAHVFSSNSVAAKADPTLGFHLVNLNVSPQFKSVRSDLRFQNLVQRIGLSR